MFGHRAFFMIGGDSPADILSLIKGGYEVLDASFNFRQDIDRTGKATTRVYSGTLDVKLSELPKNDLIDWALNSCKYTDGVIIVLDTPQKRNLTFPNRFRHDRNESRVL